MDGYQKLKEHLYPEVSFDKERIKGFAKKQGQGEMVVWITLEGFFWFPRTLLGIEPHLYAFYDLPEVMHAINQDLVEHEIRCLDQFCAICTPDFMTFAEDLSYNHGPMISEKLFEEFIAPYYRKIVPHLRRRGIITIVDSDGDIKDMVSWFTRVGVDGFLPLERQAGNDVAALRRNHPKLRMIGGYDKMVMSKDERAMRAEFERLLPVMRQGGYIPSVDHQTPPGVSLENYRIYLRLLKEYCVKAVK
jgi:uroporphyrinogen-III decarboxylase